MNFNSGGESGVVDENQPADVYELADVVGLANVDGLAGGFR